LLFGRLLLRCLPLSCRVAVLLLRWVPLLVSLVVEPIFGSRVVELLRFVCLSLWVVACLLRWMSLLLCVVELPCLVYLLRCVVELLRLVHLSF
jgi:hypothetical protein